MLWWQLMRGEKRLFSLSSLWLFKSQPGMQILRPTVLHPSGGPAEVHITLVYAKQGSTTEDKHKHAAVGRLPRKLQKLSLNIFSHRQKRSCKASFWHVSHYILSVGCIDFKWGLTEGFYPESPAHCPWERKDSLSSEWSLCQAGVDHCCFHSQQERLHLKINNKIPTS